MGPGHFRPGDSRSYGVQVEVFFASMGPGHFRPGDLSWKSKHKSKRSPRLQWGRGIFAPETTPENQLWRNADTQLQWGRGIFAPETGFGPGFHVIFGSASMGPGHFRPGDENPLASILCRYEHGFNGAGAFSPRRLETGRMVGSCAGLASMGPGHFRPGDSRERRRGLIDVFKLQWGRGIFAPETRYAGVDCILPNRASMGPGHFRPGDLFTAGLLNSNQCPLQWGRGIFAPETRRKSGLSSPGIQLQWGRGIFAPETLPT